MEYKTKQCAVCGITIADNVNSDYYSYIRVKYCKACKADIVRQQTLSRVHKLRQRKKQIDIERNIQLELLKQENELLRRSIISLKEDLKI